MTSESPQTLFATFRRQFHDVLKDRVLRLDNGVLSNADKGNRVSKDIALLIAKKIGLESPGVKLKGQTAGNEFEVATASFVRESFRHLTHLRPGDWTVRKIGEKIPDKEKSVRKNEIQKDVGRLISIARFEQYRHLIAIAKAARENPELAASLGNEATGRRTRVQRL